MAGKETYTAFRPAHRCGEVFYQYDYRHRDNDLFSCVAKTLEACREKRDRWLQKKNFAKIFPGTLKRIQENKRLTKSEMAYQIGHVEHHHPASLYWDYYRREDVVKAFNGLFGTEIK
jgi:hypothetical protein